MPELIRDRYGFYIDGLPAAFPGPPDRGHRTSSAPRATIGGPPARCGMGAVGHRRRCGKGPRWGRERILAAPTREPAHSGFGLPRGQTRIMCQHVSQPGAQASPLREALAKMVVDCIERERRRQILRLPYSIAIRRAADHSVDKAEHHRAPNLRGIVGSQRGGSMAGENRIDHADCALCDRVQCLARFRLRRTARRRLRRIEYVRVVWDARGHSLAEEQLCRNAGGEMGKICGFDSRLQPRTPKAVQRAVKPRLPS